MAILMLAEQLPFTHLLNRLFSGPVYAILKATGIAGALAKLGAPLDPHAPMPNFVAMQVLVVGILILFFIAVRTRLDVENPRHLQHMFESIHGFFNNLAEEMIGHHGHKYVPYILALGLFILLANLLGLVPGFESPTAVASVPLGCALTTWFYYHIQGIRANGIKYLKHFMGPVWWLAPLMLPIEIVSHLARIMSLTIRLFANMFAGDMVTLAFFSLVPVGVPIIFLGLHLGVSLVQTYIFVLLTCVYLSEATAHEH